MEIQKETIFLSAIRAFFKTLFGLIGIFIAFIPLFFIIFAFTPDSQTTTKNSLTILPDADGNKHILSTSSPVILRVNIDGIIGDDSLKTSVINSQLIESREGVLKNDRVKGILLYINSPGGTADDSDNIYELIKTYKEKYKVPVHAFIDGICASGGVYISLASDYISATPVSVIGSVGVIIGPFFNIVETMKKIGIESFTYTEGKDKDMMSPFRPWTESDKESLNRIAKYLYNRFIDIVIQRHPKISRQDLIQKYGANIFIAEEAEKIGFIDQYNSSYAKAIKHLLKEAKIGEKTPYQLIELKPKHTWLSEITKGANTLFSGKVKHTLQIGNKDLSEKQKLFSYLYEPSL